MRTHIYLKSGAVVDTDVDNIAVDHRNGECTGFTWTKPEDGLRLVYVDATQIAAVTVEIY